MSPTTIYGRAGIICTIFWTNFLSMFWTIFVAAGRRRWVVVRGGGRWVCVVVSFKLVAQTLHTNLAFKVCIQNLHCMFCIFELMYCLGSTLALIFFRGFSWHPFCFFSWVFLAPRFFSRGFSKHPVFFSVDVRNDSCFRA